MIKISVQTPYGVLEFEAANISASTPWTVNGVEVNNHMQVVLDNLYGDSHYAVDHGTLDNLVGE